MKKNMSTKKIVVLFPYLVDLCLRSLCANNIELMLNFYFIICWYGSLLIISNYLWTLLYGRTLTELPTVTCPSVSFLTVSAALTAPGMATIFHLSSPLVNYAKILFWRVFCKEKIYHKWYICFSDCFKNDYVFCAFLWLFLVSKGREGPRRV